jgi:hypothetical protein
MDRERPPPQRQSPDRETAGQAGGGETTYENAGLGHHIVARYGRSPGVISMEAALQRFRRTGQFGHDRLPLLTRLSGRLGGINLPFPGSGGPLTFLQPSPFVSTGFAGTERIGRSTESATTRTVAPGAPEGVSATPREPLPIARETGNRMITEGAITPTAPAATKPGSAIVRRRKSQPEALSPGSGDETPARQPGATGTAPVAPVAPVATPADSRTPGPLPHSPTHAGLGRAIISRRKHPSPEASTQTTAPVTTETGPPLRIGSRTGEGESTVGKTAMPLPRPVGSGPPPSTPVLARAFPAPASRSTSPDPPTTAADTFPPGTARRERSSPIETPNAAASRGELGTAIQLSYARTTIAGTAAPLPVSTALPQQDSPSRVDRSVRNVPALAGNLPDAWATTAGATMTTVPPTLADRVPRPQAATLQSRAEQSFRGRDPDVESPAGRRAAGTSHDLSSAHG